MHRRCFQSRRCRGFHSSESDASGCQGNNRIGAEGSECCSSCCGCGEECFCYRCRGEEEEGQVPVGWMDEVELKRQKEKARKKLKRQQAAMELKKQEEVKIQKEAEKRAKKKQMAAKKIVAVAAPVAVVSSFSSSSKSKPVPMGMFAKMPADVLAYILRMLSVHDVLRCALVSKGFERVAKNAFLWKDLYAREFPQSSIKQIKAQPIQNIY